MNRFVTLLLGLALLGAGMYCAKDLLRLQRHGTAIEGSIVDARTVHDITYSDRHGIDSNTKHTALVEFVPAGGKPVRITGEFWSRQIIGNIVKVRYNADDPGDAIVDTWYNWMWPLILAVLGGACVLSAMGLISGVSSSSSTGDREWSLFRWFD